MKKIKKNLSNLFKHIVRKIFILFNGKIITLDNKSIFLDMGIKKKKIIFFFMKLIMEKCLQTMFKM